MQYYVVIKISNVKKIFKIHAYIMIHNLKLKYTFINITNISEHIICVKCHSIYCWRRQVEYCGTYFFFKFISILFRERERESKSSGVGEERDS